MAEARDRLPRPTDEVAEMYGRRQTSIGSSGILADDGNSERSIDRNTFRWGGTPLTGGGAWRQIGGAHSTMRGDGSAGRGLFGTPRTVYRRGGRSQNTPPASGGFRRGRGGSNSILPYWYPRTPLRDISHVVRAIERRRAHLGESEGRYFSPIMAHHHHYLTVNNPSSSGAQLEQDVSLQTLNPKLVLKTNKQSTLGKIPKILAEIANQDSKESNLLTPQKKLLNSIDIVEKVVMEELHKLKRTPTAKKAEREKRVRTLMSMR